MSDNKAVFNWTFCQLLAEKKQLHETGTNKNELLVWRIVTWRIKESSKIFAQQL